MLSHRTWGDGATDGRVHAIEDVSFGAGIIDCRCGVRIFGQPLDEVWLAHGGQVLRMTAAEPSESDGIRTKDRADAAMEAIAVLGLRCTCDKTDPEDCPNYIPGDEDPLEEDEWTPST